MKLFSNKTKGIIAFITTALVLTGCTGSADTQALSTDAGAYLIISGLEDEAIEMSLDEIKKLEKVNEDVVAVTSSGEELEMSASGALFSDIIEVYGKSQQDLLEIRLIAEDGYSVIIPSEVLETRDIILAYEIDGKPLLEGDQPLRVIIPEERAMYWVSALSEIEIGTANSELVSKIVIFDSALDSLNLEDYEATDKAIKIEELLTKFAPEDLDSNVFIKAADGHEKTEDNKIFKDAYIKTTGEFAPIFTSPDMPEGMTVQNILWFRIGETSFLSMDSLIASGANMKDVLKDIGLSQADLYSFTQVDGNSRDIDAEDLYKEFEESTNAEGLLSITISK